MNYNTIIDFFKTFGWQLFLLALSGIVILGMLKWFGCFKKLKNDYKKYFYFGLSCAFSIIACTIYLLITHNFHWLSYLSLCGAVIGLTIVVYAIYEHIGLRVLWKKVLNLLAKGFKSICSAIVSGTMSQDRLKKLAVGLGSEILTELAVVAKGNEEKAKITIIATNEEVNKDTKDEADNL